MHITISPAGSAVVISIVDALMLIDAVVVVWDVVLLIVSVVAYLILLLRRCPPLLVAVVPITSLETSAEALLLAIASILFPLMASLVVPVHLSFPLGLKVRVVLG